MPSRTAPSGSAHLRKGQEAFVAGVVPVALPEPRMAVPPASGDPGVLAGPAHDLPGAEGDVIYRFQRPRPTRMRKRTTRLPSFPLRVATAGG